MSLPRVLSILTVAVVAMAGGCRSPDEAEGCILQLALYAPPSLAVGDTAPVFANALPMLPPGRGCGPAAIDWELSDSTLASLVRRGENRAVLTALRPGTLTVTAHGTARGHVADASATVRIAAAVIDDSNFLSIAAVTDTFGANVDPTRLRGTIVVMANAFFSGPDTLLLDFGVDTASVCVQPPPIRNRTSSCRIDLDQTNNGTWRFPSGTHTLRVAVRSAAGHVLMATSQAIVVAR